MERVRHHRPALHGVQPRARAREVHDELVRPRREDGARRWKVGDGLDESVEHGPAASTAASSRRCRATSRSARARARRSRPAARRSTEGAHAKGIFYQPTVFAGREGGRAHRASRRSSGPVLSHREGEGPRAHAVTVNNASRLRAVVVDLHERREPRVRGHARPRHRHRVREPRHHRRRDAPAVRRQLAAPATATARPATRCSTPFTEWKSIYVDFSGKLQRAQIDNS